MTDPLAPKDDKSTDLPFKAAMADAARRAGFGQIADGEPLTAKALLKAVGGIRGLLETILPALVFLVVYSLTQNLIPSLIAPVVVGVGFTVWRLIDKTPFNQAIAGLAGVAISVVLALISGRGQDYYVFGFWTNGLYGLGFLISVVVGWPLVGLAVGFLMSDGVAWKKDRVKFRAMQWLTLLWVGLFAVRLAVQLPLYFAENVEALGATRLIMGVPLYAPLLVLSWLIVRAVYRPRPAPEVLDLS